MLGKIEGVPYIKNERPEFRFWNKKNNKIP